MVAITWYLTAGVALAFFQKGRIISLVREALSNEQIPDEQDSMRAEVTAVAVVVAVIALSWPVFAVLGVANRVSGHE